MFNIIFRRFRVIESNLRQFKPIVNGPTALYSTNHTPQALKRKKSKAKDSTVSSIGFSTEKIVNKIFRCSGITLWI